MRSSQNKMTYINLRIFCSDIGSKKEVTTVKGKIFKHGIYSTYYYY